MKKKKTQVHSHASRLSAELPDPEIAPHLTPPRTPQPTRARTTRARSRFRITASMQDPVHAPRRLDLSVQ
jgi:hypothetical protein